MSHRLTKSALAATALLAFSILGGQWAFAADPDDNINQARKDCAASQPVCKNLDGNALTNCELRVGQIVHACNKVRDYEQAHGGPGPKFNGATNNRNNAVNRGEVD